MFHFIPGMGTGSCRYGEIDGKVLGGPSQFGVWTKWFQKGDSPKQCTRLPNRAYQGWFYVNEFLIHFHLYLYKSLRHNTSINDYGAQMNYIYIFFEF